MKKILGLVMVVVLALCLGGCGQIVPKADYVFTTEEFMYAFYRKGAGERADNFYLNKRIELKGCVDFKEQEHVVLKGGEDDKVIIWFNILFRNEADRNKFLEEEYVKLSVRFRRVGAGKFAGKDVVIFDFDDGIFLEKL